MTEDVMSEINLKSFCGKTIAGIIADINDSGYGFVQITFLDKTSLIIKEEGQAGYISVTTKEYLRSL